MQRQRQQQEDDDAEGAAARPVVDAFGDAIGRCCFASEWRLRREGLDRVGRLLSLPGRDLVLKGLSRGEVS
jgi:hypothetical protein